MMAPNMKIGFNEATSRECSTLEKDLALCEQLGFDYIEIRYDKLREYLQTHTLQELERFFLASRIKPHAVNALYLYPEMFGENDDTARLAEKMAELKLALEIAKMSDDPSLIVVAPMRDSRFSEPYLGSWEDTRSACIRILRTLSDMVSGEKMKLCFELVGARKSSVRSVAQANEIVQAVNRDNVGLVLDVANVYMNGKLTDYSCIRTVDVNKVFCVHLNDFDDVAEEEFSIDNRCLCGRGVANVEGFLEALKSIGYDGVASIEVFRPEYWAMKPEELIPLAYQTTYDILKKCGCIE